MKQKTAYARRKQVRLKNVKSKLKDLKDKDVSPKKKANLVKHLKNLMKWNSRDTHATKRKRTKAS